MKSYWHPEVATSSQEKAREQSSSAGIEETQPIFADVANVAVTKCRRRNDGGRPEPNASGQREQPISAVVKFLLQCDHEESKSIERAPFPNLAAAQGDFPKSEESSQACQSQESSQAHRGHCRPCPEPGTEHLPPRQTVIGNCSRFDFRHDPARQQKNGELQRLVHEVAYGLVATVRQPANEGGLGETQ